MSYSTAKRTLVPLIVLSLLLVSAQIQVTAMMPFDCCYNTSRKPVPIKAIKKYTVQLSGQICDTNAIIFQTKKGLAICADPEDKWVKKAVKMLNRKANRSKHPRKDKRKSGTKIMSRTRP